MGLIKFRSIVVLNLRHFFKKNYSEVDNVDKYWPNDTLEMEFPVNVPKCTEAEPSVKSFSF